MRSRLLAAFLTVVVAILAVQDIPLIAYLRAEERDRITLTLERDAWALAGLAEPALDDRDFAKLQDIAASYGSANGSRVEIVDADATVLASTDTAQLGYDYTNRPEIVAALAGRAVTGERDSADLGDRMLYVTVPIAAADASLGALRLTYPVASIRDIVEQRLRSLYVSGALTLAIAIGAAVLLAAITSRRLRRIHAATEQLATGDLTARVETIPSGAPEIRGLETAFNNMASRLQTLVEAQHAFASDASHQLRTPLTALRLRLENMATRADDAQATRAAVEAAAVEVQRMQTLVDGLLAIARLEGRATTLVPIDVRSVLAERVDLWEPLATERGITLRVDNAEGIEVLAAEGTLEQILDAYLDNALEYAPDGSALHLACTHTDDTVSLHVIDAGPGLDPEQRAAPSTASGAVVRTATAPGWVWRSRPAWRRSATAQSPSRRPRRRASTPSSRCRATSRSGGRRLRARGRVGQPTAALQPQGHDDEHQRQECREQRERETPHDVTAVPVADEHDGDADVDANEQGTGTTRGEGKRHRTTRDDGIDRALAEDEGRPRPLGLVLRPGDVRQALSQRQCPGDERQYEHADGRGRAGPQRKHDARGAQIRPLEAESEHQSDAGDHKQQSFAGATHGVTRCSSSRRRTSAPGSAASRASTRPRPGIVASASRSRMQTSTKARSWARGCGNVSAGVSMRRSS